MIPPAMIVPAPAGPESPEALAGSQRTPAGPRGDGVPFPTVLLALASIGSPAPAAALPVALPTVLPEEVTDVATGSDGSEAVAFAPVGVHDWILPGEPVTMALGAATEVGPSAPAEHTPAEHAPADHPLDDAPIEAGAVVSEPALQVSDAQVPATPVQVAQEAPAAAETASLDPRMLHNLSRDFVPRLRRVAERMWDEHGLRLQVVEGYRTQARQNELFAQGRTSEGPVVTWTRESLHTAGAAADVYVDGAPVAPEQARILARVAGEEGLRTLYPYDSGHIQMEGRGALDGPDIPGDRGLPTPAASGSSARPGVAPVAPVARPARPARPGGMAMANEGQSDEAAGAPRSRVEVGALAARATPRTAPDTHPNRGEGVAARRPEPGPVPAESPSGPPRAADPAAALPPVPHAPPHGSTEGLRVEAPRTAADPAPPMPVEQTPGFEQLAYRRLRLPIDGLPGSASLDVGMRSGAVDARLNVTDPQLAEDLQRGLHELRTTLADRGIDTRALSVRLVAQAGAETQSAGTEGAAAARGAAEGSTGQSSGDSHRGAGQRSTHPFDRRDDPTRSGRHQRPEEDPDGPHQ